MNSNFIRGDRNEFSDINTWVFAVFCEFSPLTVTDFCAMLGTATGSGNQFAKGFSAELATGSISNESISNESISIGKSSTGESQCAGCRKIDRAKRHFG